MNSTVTILMSLVTQGVQSIGRPIFSTWYCGSHCAMWGGLWRWKIGFSPLRSAQLKQESCPNPATPREHHKCSDREKHKREKAYGHFSSWLRYSATRRHRHHIVSTDLDTLFWLKQWCSPYAWLTEKETSILYTQLSILWLKIQKFSFK